MWERMGLLLLRMLARLCRLETSQEDQGVTNENMKNASLVSALQDHALTWYIKYSSDHLNPRIAVIQDALNKDFSQPKSETQLVIGFKEITILPSETPWDLD